MKLGLIIKNTNGGEAEGFSINKKDDWTRYASDARSAIKELDYFDESGKVVYLVRFLGSLGYLFCVIKARPQGSGRANDNTAAWIYVPSKVKMSEREMENILKEVEKAISGELGTDEDKLKKVFEKDYPEKDVLYTAVESIESKKEGSYALIYYNDVDYQLYELIGDSLFQKEYEQYGGLFLVDKNLEIKLTQGEPLNINPKKLVTIHPVKEQLGFTPYFRSQKFDQDIEVFDKSEVTIEWRKERYAPIKTSFTVGTDNISKLDIKPEEIKWRIRRSEITVKTDKGEIIDDATIQINGKLPEHCVWNVSEDDRKAGLKVKVSAEGYNNAEELYNERGVIVTLSRKTYHKVLEIDVENASNGELSFDSFSEDISKSSPVKGYEVVKNGKKERLQYNGNEGKANDIMTKFFSIGFASCFALILLLFGGWHFFKADTPKREVKVVTVEGRGNKDSSKTVQDTVAQATPTQEESKNKMKAYLSQPMTKDSCKNLGYEDLWTALNTYNVEKVEEYAQEFSKLQEVVERLRECEGAGELKKLKGKTYAEAKNTEKIYLTDYVNFLETLSLSDFVVGQPKSDKDTSVNSTSPEKEPNSGTEQGDDSNGRPKN